MESEAYTFEWSIPAKRAFRKFAKKHHEVAKHIRDKIIPMIIETPIGEPIGQGQKYCLLRPRPSEKLIGIRLKFAFKGTEYRASYLVQEKKRLVKCLGINTKEGFFSPQEQEALMLAARKREEEED